MRIVRPISEHKVTGSEVTEAVIASAWDRAVQYHTEHEIVYPEVFDDIGNVREGIADNVESSGGKFFIPLLLPEGVETGDGRTFDAGAASFRDLPMALLWQVKTASGHDGSYIVGRIDSIERVEGGLGNVRGVFDTGPYGREAERLVRGGFLRGVSADLDKFEGSVDESEEEEYSSKSIKNQKTSVKKGRVMAATLVAKPAFQECAIMIEEDPSLPNSEIEIKDGEYEEFLDDIDNELAALAASAAPVIPPKDWFKDPKLSGPTPLTITDEGKVYGHIAAWHVDHIGLPRATKPPRSATNYAYFCTGALRTDQGDVHVGQLTLAGGHAPMEFSAPSAVEHYDNTASALADVTAGEDQFGIWVAGALRPEATPAQVRALRASAPSGDWRPINGRLELVAVCQVNVPGFPVARTMVAGGQMTALVAAGAAPLAQLRETETTALESRIEALENKELSAKRLEALSVLEPLRVEKETKLKALAASAAMEIDGLRSGRKSELAAQVAELKRSFYNREA